MFQIRSILITGGTGSLGRALVPAILSHCPDLDRLVVFSRDELKQYEMQHQYPEKKFPVLRFFLGDVRDRTRLARAFRGIDVVIHAAALKQVPAAEYNPIEFVRTNVLGAENVIEAAMDVGVKTVIALSTDKAAGPANLYGATKLCGDKLFMAAHHYLGSDLKCSVVRYGNVMGSRGSVIPYFLKRAKSGVLPITHPEMTRFNISLKQGVELVLNAIENAKGGEMFVPKIPSYRIIDVAKAIGPGCKHESIGIRPGEKLHEEMITEHDSYMTLDLGNQYVVCHDRHVMEKILAEGSGKPVRPGFAYCSESNPEFLSVDQIRELIQTHIDPDFTPI